MDETRAIGVGVIDYSKQTISQFIVQNILQTRIQGGVLQLAGDCKVIFEFWVRPSFNLITGIANLDSPVAVMQDPAILGLYRKKR